MYATIDDLYAEVCRRYYPDGETERSRDEVRECVQDTVGRYEAVDDDWFVLHEDWLLGNVDLPPTYITRTAMAFCNRCMGYYPAAVHTTESGSEVITPCPLCRKMDRVGLKNL